MIAIAICTIVLSTAPPLGELKEGQCPLDDLNQYKILVAQSSTSGGGGHFGVSFIGINMTFGVDVPRSKIHVYLPVFKGRFDMNTLFILQLTCQECRIRKQLNRPGYEACIDRYVDIWSQLASIMLQLKLQLISQGKSQSDDVWFDRNYQTAVKAFAQAASAVSRPSMVPQSLNPFQNQYPPVYGGETYDGEVMERALKGNR